MSGIQSNILRNLKKQKNLNHDFEINQSIEANQGDTNCRNCRYGHEMIILTVPSGQKVNKYVLFRDKSGLKNEQQCTLKITKLLRAIKENI